MSTAQTKLPRNEYLDFCKGILIFLVVWGHLIQTLGYVDYGFFEDPVFKAIYTFHMPLFMAISGYLSHSSFGRHSGSTIIRRRFGQLLVPVFAWAALFQLGVAAKVIFWDGTTIRDATAQFPLACFKIASSFWFLWALLLFTGLIAVLRVVRRDTMVIMAMVFLLYLLVPHLGKDYLFRFTLPFFCLGYEVARVGVPPVSQSWWVTAATAAGSIACYLLWQRDDYVYVSQMTLNIVGVKAILFRLVAGIIVSIFILRTLLALYKVRVLHPFVWLGKRSLEVYILHGLTLRLAQYYPTPFHQPIMFSTLEAPLLAVGLCLLCGAAAEASAGLMSKLKRAFQST